MAACESQLRRKAGSWSGASSASEGGRARRSPRPSVQGKRLRAKAPPNWAELRCAELRPGRCIDCSQPLSSPLSPPDMDGRHCGPPATTTRHDTTTALSSSLPPVHHTTPPAATQSGAELWSSLVCTAARSPVSPFPPGACRPRSTTATTTSATSAPAPRDLSSFPMMLRASRLPVRPQCLLAASHRPYPLPLSRRSFAAASAPQLRGTPTVRTQRLAAPSFTQVRLRTALPPLAWRLSIQPLSNTAHSLCAALLASRRSPAPSPPSATPPG